MAINRKYWQWIEQAITAFWSQTLMTTRLSIGFGGLLASSVAPQVLPSWLYVYMKPHRIYAELAKFLWNAYVCGIHLASSIVDTNIGQHFPPGHFCSNSIKPCPRTHVLTLMLILIQGWWKFQKIWPFFLTDLKYHTALNKVNVWPGQVNGADWDIWWVELGYRI